MKKILFLIVSLISISIILFVVFTKANYSKLTSNEALKIGEEKYLEFLWMVDGAFYDERLGSEYTVNGKKLSDDKKVFTCIYKDQKDSNCVGENFEEEFSKLFASNISFNQVYGDGTFYKWFKNEKGEFVFNSLNGCNTKRMKLQQHLELKSIENDEIRFMVDSDDDNESFQRIREFLIIREGNTWKVSRAYYHDLCEIDYNIG